MSGGSYDYAFLKVDGVAASLRIDDAGCANYVDVRLRKRFRTHLQLVARAMKAIEWNDSCDGDDGEQSAIRACLNDYLRPGEVDPIPMLLWCPECRARHLDVGEFATRPHHTHACQQCGHVWRPAIVHTVGVQFLPGFKNSSKEAQDDG